MPPSRKPVDVDDDSHPPQDTITSSSIPEYPDAATEHHLSSISILYNRMDYHVLGRIVYDFRVDDTEGKQVLSRITLVPLVNPQTQAEPTAIEVYFHGKWRHVCSSLKKRDIICLANASVENATDPDYHEVQLAFHERSKSSPRQSASQEGRVATLFLMEGESPTTRKPVSVVTQSTLSLGFIPIPTSAPAPTSGSTAGPGVNDDGKTIKKQRKQPRKPAAASSGGTRGSRYEYRSVASVNEEAASMSGNKGSTFNVYGVIIGAKSPSTCTGPDLRSTITILDESSISGTSEIASTKVLEIYRFDRDPRTAIPFCVRGDIIRCHRLQLTKFTDRSGTTHIQGHAQNHSTFLMWAAETDAEKPLTDMAPIRSNVRTPIVNHTMSDSDMIRVKKLREFSKSYMEGLNPNVDRPWMKTVDQVVNAGIGAEFLENPIQLLGKYIPSKNGAVGDLGTIKFSIRDGVKEDVTMKIESVISAEHRNKMAQFPYEAFARSLKLHTIGNRDTKWMLINEIRVAREHSTNARNGKLSVGRHTSTIEWLPDHAPEVRGLMATTPKPKSADGTNRNIGNGDNNNTNNNTAAPMDGITSQGLRDVAADVRAETEATTIAVQNALALRWVTVGIHPGTHLKVERVRAVLRAAQNDRRKLIRVQAKVCSMDHPENVQDVTKLYCVPCSVYTGDNTICPTCGTEAEWAFRGRLVMADDDGTWIHAWVTDNEFFKPKIPRKITNIDEPLAQWIQKVTEKLMEATTRFDCLVQPYAVENQYGIKMPACRIVHTQVLQLLEDSGTV